MSGFESSRTFEKFFGALERGVHYLSIILVPVLLLVACESEFKPTSIDERGERLSIDQVAEKAPEKKSEKGELADSKSLEKKESSQNLPEDNNKTDEEVGILEDCPAAVEQDVTYSCAIPAGAKVPESVTYSLSASNTCGWASINANTGDVTGTPDDDDVGPCTLSIETSENVGDTSSFDHSILVSNVSPTLSIAGANVAEDSSDVVIRSDGDVASSEEGFGTYSLDSGTTTNPKCSDNGLISIDPQTGAINFDPNDDYDIDCNVKVQFDDGNSDSSTVSAEFLVSIAASNDVPVVSQACATSAQVANAFSCTPSVSDPDTLDSHTWSLDVSNTCSWVGINSSTGELTGTPGGGDIGACTMAFLVNDGVINSTVESISFSVVNTAPTFTFVQPMGDDDFPVVGSTFNITWTDSDPDDNAAIDLFYKTTNSGPCSSGTSIQSGISEDDGTDLIGWNTTGVIQGIYYICAVIDDGSNTAVEVYSDKITPLSHCTWSGASSTTWTDSSNWMNCAASAPTAGDFVVVPSEPSNQPTLSSDVTILGFGHAYNGGGTVTIASGVTLTASDADIIRSDIIFEGDSTTCTDCQVYVSTQTSSVSQGATMTLGSGITLSHVGYSTVKIGDGTTAAHLVVLGGATQAEWPIVKGPPVNGFKGFDIEGTASEKSSVTVDGLQVLDLNSHNPGSVNGVAFDFKDHFQIVQFDDFYLDSEGTSIVSMSNTMALSNCGNATVDDTNWDGLNITFANAHAGFNIDATNCTGLSTINISGTGIGYGSIYESDPNSLFNWANDIHNTCTWTGATDTSWINPANWNNCVNGRGDYPDHQDRVIIPVTGTQPLVSQSIVIDGIAAGTGGGTITIASGVLLVINESDDEISSDITFTGAADDCSDCTLRYRNLDIVNNATITFYRGINFLGRSYGVLRVGDGSEAGHLKVLPNSANTDHWPVFGSYEQYGDGIKVHGASAAEKSSVEINGMKTTTNMHYGRVTLDFIDNFQIDRLDSMILEYYGTTLKTDAAIEVQTCANSTINDLTWSEIDFRIGINTPPAGYNFSIENCSGLGVDAIQVTKMSGGVNTGWGEASGNDPDNVLDVVP